MRLSKSILIKYRICILEKKIEKVIKSCSGFSLKITENFVLNEKSNDHIFAFVLWGRVVGSGEMCISVSAKDVPNM